jgi:glutamate 5-kinase
VSERSCPGRGRNFFLERHIQKNRARWIILARASGTVHVDAGAKAAVLGKNSLLPAGIVEVEGSFDRGDVVGLGLRHLCERNYSATREIYDIKGIIYKANNIILKKYDNVIKKNMY